MFTLCCPSVFLLVCIPLDFRLVRWAVSASMITLSSYDYDGIEDDVVEGRNQSELMGTAGNLATSFLKNVQGTQLCEAPF